MTIIQKARYILLFVLFVLLVLITFGSHPLFASSYKWTQTDWSGGADSAATATHNIDNTSWTKFYSKDNYVNVSTGGQISLSPIANTWTQTADIQDFDAGVLSNLRIVGNGQYVATRSEENSPSVTKTGTWTTYALGSASGGSYIRSTTLNSSATFSFTGTNVSWIGYKGSTFGIADVYLDNVLQGSVDCYNSTLLSQQVLWSIANLSNGTHTLKIVVTNRFNPSALDKIISVDAFDVRYPYPDPGAYLTFVDSNNTWLQTGDLLDFDRGIFTNTKVVGNGQYVTTRSEETSSSVTKTGTWTSYALGSASGGNYIRSTTLNSSATFSFTGTSVSWIGYKGSTFGIADVYIDNVFKASVDCYNSTLLSQQVLWSIANLSNGTHTLKIVVTNRFNPSALDKIISVDAFDVTSANPDPAAYLMLVDGVPNGTYDSPSFDAGSGAAFFTISWNAVIPAGSNLKFQIATNNNNATWNFIGPDGTANSFYLTSGSNILSSHTGNRYLKYRVYFDRPTLIPADSPVLNDVSINYGILSYLHGSYVSPSLDVGLSGAFYFTIGWNATVPAGASLRFQIAANNDNATWNFVGPDGTAGTYYTTSGDTIYQGHNGNQYIKYKVLFDRPTLYLVDTPVLNDVTITYGLNAPFQILVSSPFNTTDSTNVIRRLMWSENLPSGTDINLQLRTSPDGVTWSKWYGPHSTSFSSSAGASQITVASVAGFSVGSRVVLTNSTNPNQTEFKKITGINSGTNVITLDSNTGFVYSANSIFTDNYTDPAGTEPINNLHRSGNDDVWLQYRVILFTIYGTISPVFYENSVSYFPAIGSYQPDGIIDGNGDNIYGSAGSGGASSKFVNPGITLLSPLTYDIRLQNDGNADSIDDKYSISWNVPSDVSGNWTINLVDLNDPNNPGDDVIYTSSPVSSPVLNFGAEKLYTLKVTPSANAPADSIQDIVVDIHSQSDYIKSDSVKATAHVNKIFQADGLIDGAGNNVYDSTGAGLGGTSNLKSAFPDETLQYTITLQNEGNSPDTYKISLLRDPPAGWKILLNDGSKDYDITNPGGGYTTSSIRSVPYSDSSKTYTLKIIPRGTPVTENIILNIFSTGGGGNLDSVTAVVKLNPIYKFDGIINSYTISGGGCGALGAGDNVYGVTGSGNGGCTGIDIPGGTAKNITVGVQNEGNVPDKYQISWNIPLGWGVVMQETRNDGSPIEYNITPLTVPTSLAGNPSNYNPGEVPFFTFKITPPSSFAAGSPAQTIIFDIKSIGDNTKVDSLKAVINSSDTTPPSSVVLTPGSITTKSIKISWTAPGDDGTSGTASSYDLRISSAPFTTDAVFNNAEKVKSCKTGESTPGKPKSSGSSESCTVSGLFADTDYYFALKSTDDAGNTSAVSTCSACPAHTLVSNDTTTPGNITDLSVTGSSKDTITLCWTAKADDGSDISSDTVTVYDLRYSRRNIVEDSVTPGVGEVKFSNAAILIPSGGFLPPKSSGMKECYIVPVENKIDLGGGIIEDRTQNTRFYFAVKALDEARNKSSISNIAGGMTTLTPNAYNMVSVPYHPVAPDDTPVAVFGDDVGLQLYVYGWDSRGPNWSNGCYNGWPLPNNVGSNVCTQLTSVKEGRGYFLWTPSASISIDVPVTSTVPVVQDCTDDTLPVPVHFQCYVMLLQNGWNMIGPPFDKEMNFSSRDIGGIIERGLYIRKTTGGNSEVAKFQTAATSKNWLDGSVYTFNGTNYTYETCNQDGAGESLGTQCSLVFQPWKAYWIRVHGGGSSTFELLVPN